MRTQPDPSPRFARPADDTRPYGSHRYEVWSPKVRRRLTLFGEVSLKAWVTLEADITVSTFCERPLVIGDVKPPRIADFWFQRHDLSEQILLVARPLEEQLLTKLLERYSGFAAWAKSEGIQFQIIRPDDFYLSPVSFENWRTILHHLAANHALVRPSLVSRVLKERTSAIAIHTIEQVFDTEDPVIVRAAIFTLVHQGKLRCESLESELISGKTRVVQV